MKTNPESESESETKGTILLVDDLPENLQLLSDILLERGYTVRRVTSGRMAIKTIRIKPPDVILLDIKMPEMDGYEVCQALKADPDLCDIPVIFISALDKTFDQVKAFESGGVDYITKPFQVEEVVARVENQLTIQRQKKAIQESEKRFSTIFNNNPDPIWISTLAEGRCLNVNDSLCQFLGAPREKILGNTCVELALWNDLEDLKHFRQTIIQEGMIQNFEVVIHTQSGEAKDVLLSAKRERLNGEDCVIGVMKDISYRKQVETFLRQYERIVSATTDGISLIDRNYIYRVVNQIYLDWHNKPSEEIIGHSVSEILGEQAFKTIIKYHLDHCLQGEPIYYEEWFDFEDHKRRFVRVKYSPYIETDGTISGVVVNVHDLTDIKQIQQELQKANQKLKLIANLDGLTQIANRRRFDDYLGLEWKRHLREQQPLGLIMIDIDYFKRYNDYYGHQGGDDCLIRVAQIIAKTPQRATDLVARYGGEEFVVILPNTNAENALIVAEAIRKEIAFLKIPHAVSQVSQYVTLSLGVASLIPTPENSPEDLTAKADQALYTAKNQGRDRAIRL